MPLNGLLPLALVYVFVRPLLCTVVTKGLLWPEVHRLHPLRTTRYNFLQTLSCQPVHPKSTYQFLKHAFVQTPLGRPTLPQLLVVVFKTLPVRPELVQAVRVDVGNDAGGTARDLAALSHAVQLAAALGLGLAGHVVIVEGAAAGTDEEGGREERCGRGTDFGHRGD
jgi:hypothetical protein